MQRPGRLLDKVLALMLALMLAAVSMQAVAKTSSAKAAAKTPPVASTFDHTSTGFPLTGGHATATCKTCHVGDVFKGTPKTCDSCHALGKRVVATPKPTNHVRTDAPCDSCHFSTASFLGALFNHGSAMPGQCVTCHNGRITTGRPANHNVGAKATGSCDSCHRTFAWLPASWDHVGVVPHTCDSAGCHVQGSNQFYKPANHQTSPYLDRNSFYCDDCHNVFAWLPAPFMHNRPSPAGVCMGCHDGSNAPGKNAGHVATTADCVTCHTSTISWFGALGNMPANHIPFNAGAQCSTCHPTTATWITGASLHAQVSPVCKTCHDTSSPAYLGNMTKVTLGNHNGSTPSQDCTACHTLNYTTWTGAITSMPANHIPFNAGAQCATCHPTPATWVTGAALHVQVSPVCSTCHNSTPVYLGNMTRVTLGNHNGSTTSQDCIACHSLNYTSWSGALSSMPSNHIPFNAGVQCNTCHPTPATWVTGAALHVQVSPVCKTCHNSTPVYLGNMTRVTLGNHQRSTTSQDCISCHTVSYTRWSN